MADTAPTLAELGWTEALARHFEPFAREGLVAARVAVEHRTKYGLYTERGEAEAALTGKARHEAVARRDRPAVGDWVAVAAPPPGGVGAIHAVLPRASAFTRKVAGREHEEQVVAANIDVAFLVTSLNAELNHRRLERYLTLAWKSGARPVVVLTKADRCEDPAALVREVEAVAVGVAVLLTSAKTGLGIEELRGLLADHNTGTLLGSSGVGKSTLMNALVGWERQDTGAIREADDRGRHTTSRRELVRMPGGGLLIDTPGMRELQLSEAGDGLLSAFDDVAELARGCAFRDCGHGPEPDCAVRDAVTAGRLSAERLESFHKLVRELEKRTGWGVKRTWGDADPNHGR
ncbi:MAG: ribosome small subunit-dependent GTPase A [Gemmatimonadota bacterium]